MKDSVMKQDDHYIDLLNSLRPVVPTVGFEDTEKGRPEIHLGSVVTVQDVLAILRDINRSD
jgi:hypothetical protein